ncbi:integrase catalytic subunit [Mesorhizobium sediminum]|nr:integrase catalytic subunit [Mesorhizobium sediminum]
MYNTERPHSTLGYKPPAPEAMVWPAPPRGSTLTSARAMAAKPIMQKD